MQLAFNFEVIANFILHGVIDLRANDTVRFVEAVEPTSLSRLTLSDVMYEIQYDKVLVIYHYGN